jgi:hypothetical protein
MTIDFDTELDEISSRLKGVKGYMDCEIIILQHIKKQQDDGLDDEAIAVYLEKLSAWLHKKMRIGNAHPDYTNLMFAAGFVDYLLKMAR